MIHVATLDEAMIVAEMATALTSQIIQRTGVQHFNIDLPKGTKLCHGLIESRRYVALIATEESNPVGFAGLCESHALYPRARSK